MFAVVWCCVEVVSCDSEVVCKGVGAGMESLDNKDAGRLVGRVEFRINSVDWRLRDVT